MRSLSGHGAPSAWKAGSSFSARRLGISTVLVACVTLGAVGIFLWHYLKSQTTLRHQVLQQTEKGAAQLADAMAGQVDVFSRSVDFALLQLRETYASDPARFHTTVDLLMQSFGGNALANVSVVRADGTLAQSTSASMSSATIVGRTYFRTHREGGDRLIVSGPERAGGDPAIYFSRPIVDQGKFAGVVLISVSPQVLSSKFGTLALPPDDSIWITNGNGQFVAGARELEQSLGKPPSGWPFLLPDAPGHGSFRANSVVDGSNKILAWRRSETTGWTVLGALDERSALAPLEADFRIGILRVGTVAILLLLGGAGTIALLALSARQQRLLAGSEARYRGMFESAPLPMFLTSQDSKRILGVNDAACRQYGYTHEEFRSLEFKHILSDVGVAMPAEWRTQHPGESGQALREQHRRKDGSSFPVEVYPVTVEGRSNLVVTMVLDVSVREHYEEHLRRMNEGLERRVEHRARELVQAQEQFKLVLDNMRDVISLRAAQSLRLLYMSPAYHQMYDQSSCTLQEKQWPWLERVLPEHRARVTDWTGQTMAAGDALEIEFPISRRNGELRWLRLRRFCIASHNSEDVILTVTEDATDRRLADELRLAREAEHRETLIREVHHRIKNNLQGAIGLLRLQLGETPELSATLNEAAARLQTIGAVYGLHAEPGGSDVQLCRLVPAVASAVSDLFGVRIETDVPSDQAVVLGNEDAVAIALVVNELFTNAMKHRAKDAQIPLRARLRCAQGAARLHITNAGTLPEGFDLDAGCGTGSGIRLLKSLLPARGATLRIVAIGGTVEALLELRPPVVSFSASAHSLEDLAA